MLPILSAPPRLCGRQSNRSSKDPQRKGVGSRSFTFLRSSSLQPQQPSTSSSHWYVLILWSYDRHSPILLQEACGIDHLPTDLSALSTLWCPATQTLSLPHTTTDLAPISNVSSLEQKIAYHKAGPK